MKVCAMLSCSTIALALVAASGPARAVPIVATFTGIAQGSFVHGMSPPPGSVDGQLVTGTFRFDPALAVAGGHCPPGFQYCGMVGSPTLEFHLDGQTATFDEEGLASVEVGLDGAQIDFLPESLPDDPYHYSSLWLVGDLIDGDDLSTFHAGPVDLAKSGAQFFDSRDFGSGVLLTSFTFLSAVPEPSGTLLMLAAAGLLGARLGKGARRGTGARRP